MKKVLQILCVTAAIFFVAGIGQPKAQDIFSKVVPSGQTLWFYKYSTTFDSVIVIAPNAYDWGNYSKPTGNLVIPDSVTYIGHTYYVRNILSYAFVDCAGLQSVTIGNGLKSIGREAFRGCYGMTHVTIGTDITVIGQNAFQGCSGLTGITAKPQACILSNDSVFFGVDSTINVSVPCDAELFYGILWPYFSNFTEELLYDVNAIVNHSYMGSVEVSDDATCDSPIVTLTAVPQSIYSFVEWSDGVTDNPRQITLSSDTTLVAIFDYVYTPPTYTLTVVPNDENMGETTGSGTYESGTEVTITATPKEGHRFVRWQDGNTQNERTVYVYSNRTYTAYFEPLTAINDSHNTEPGAFASQGLLWVKNVMGQEVHVYDQLGRLVCKFHATSSNVSVKVPGNGLYFVRVGDMPTLRVMVIR